MKKLMVLFALLVAIALPATVLAEVLRVVPVGGSETGMAIITNSPATLEAFTTDGESLTGVWLLFVIDDKTYNGLGSITVNNPGCPMTPPVLEQDDFCGPIDSGEIPNPTHYDPTSDYPCDWPHCVVNHYPGCTAPTQYQVDTVMDQMAQVHPRPDAIYYVLIYGFTSLNAIHQSFSVTVDSSTHINVLVLAQGRDSEAGELLNVNSPFSGSALIVPELGPILLALASFSALALYLIKRKRT